MVKRNFLSFSGWFSLMCLNFLFFDLRLTGQWGHFHFSSPSVWTLKIWALRWPCVLNFESHWLQSNFGLVWTFFKWCPKLILRAKPIGQCGQINGSTPSWTLSLWLFSSYLDLNSSWHRLQILIFTSSKLFSRILFDMMI